MVKKTFLILFCLLLVVLSVYPCFAMDPTISVGMAAAMRGEIVTIPVKFSGNPGVNTFTFGFSYDAARLTLADAKAASQLGGQFVYKKKAVWLNNQNVTYNGDVVFMRFQVPKNAADGFVPVTVTYEPGDIANYDEEDVNFTVEPGGIFVGLKQKTVDRFSALVKKMTAQVRTICESAK